MKKTGGYIFVILSSIGFGLSPLLASFVTAYGVGSIMMTFMNTILLLPASGRRHRNIPEFHFSCFRYSIRYAFL